MKKLISSILAITMILTMVLSVPVNAAPYKGYPFIYEDFENGVPSGHYIDRAGLTVGTDNGIKADPTGRSGKVYKAEIDASTTSTARPQYVIDNCNVGINLDSTTKSSVMIYFENGVPATNAMSIVHTLKITDAEETTFWQGWYESVLKPTWSKGNWVKYEADVTWSKNLAFGTSGATEVQLTDSSLDWSTLKMIKYSFRFGDAANPTFSLDKMDEDETMLTMYFDEFKFEPYHNTTGPEVKYGENLLAYGDFTNGATTGCHCHFTLRKDGELVDPEEYLKEALDKEKEGINWL